MRPRTLLLLCLLSLGVGGPVGVGACGGRALSLEGTQPPADDAGIAREVDGSVVNTGGRAGRPGRGGSDTGGASGSSPGGATTGGAPSCGSLLSCGSSCVDASRDENHCGSCYRACRTGQSCVAGRCQDPSDECLPNETLCNNWGCIDLSSNIFACGDCNRGCTNGERCIGGQCVYGTCINGGTFCEGDPGAGTFSSCVTNFSSNWSHCGGCFNQCGPYEDCINGQCTEPTCDEYYCGYDAGTCTYVYCEQSGCTDVANDVAHCGGCEQACTGSPSIFSWDAYVCRSGTCGCSALATPCGPGCAERFSYCPQVADAGPPLDVCNTLARNAYDRCGCSNCLDEVRACAESATCINAMDCALRSPCIGCSEPFYPCSDQYGETDPVADALVACLNQNCANP